MEAQRVYIPGHRRLDVYKRQTEEYKAENGIKENDEVAEEKPKKARKAKTPKEPGELRPLKKEISAEEDVYKRQGLRLASCGRDWRKPRQNQLHPTQSKWALWGFLKTEKNADFIVVFTAEVLYCLLYTSRCV